ncbi:MAG: hypothetical protein IPM29_20755 [Planctomycetes bacterium]|nr:hypothetical protein [Planctomycetota bacterium]
MTAPITVPPLWQRVLPLLLIGSVLAAIRLTLDATVPDGRLTMYVGTWLVMPFAIAWVGLTRRYGPISFRQMAFTMVVVAATVWGAWNVIAYTTGQFMGWTHGRFDPGHVEIAADGTETRVGARAMPIQATAWAKLGAGLLHGVLSTAIQSVICTVLGTLLIWLPARSLRRA